MSYRHLADRRYVSHVSKRCYLCGESIQPGTEYLERVGVQDGELCRMTVHPECEAETRSWDVTDWETFCEGELERPR